MTYKVDKSIVQEHEEIVTCKFCGDEFLARKSMYRKYCTLECFRQDVGNQAKHRRNRHYDRGVRDVRAEIAKISMSLDKCCHSTLVMLDKHLKDKLGAN
jgi:hypothetical protein